MKPLAMLVLALMTMGALGCSDAPGPRSARKQKEDGNLADVLGKCSEVKGMIITVIPVGRPGETLSITTDKDTLVLVDGEKATLNKIEKGRAVLISRPE